MNQKKDVEVLINNKRYVICGHESPDYIQKIASYINRTMADLKSKEWYRDLDQDMKSVLLEINLADEYFKAIEKMNEIELIQKQSDHELFEIKHEIIKKQTEFEELTSAYEELKAKYDEAQKTIITLQAKMER